MNEHDAKLTRSIVWAIAAALVSAIVSQNVYWSIRDSAAIRAGLQQTPNTVGGYWIKGE